MEALAGPSVGPLCRLRSDASPACTRPSSEIWGRTLRCTTSNATVHLAPTHSRHSLKVEMAISRKKKEATVDKARQELENCYLVASINYKKFTVKQFSDLRSKLPESASLVVMKNSLLEKAIEGTEWEALKPSMTGMNAFLFVHSEEIPPALKPFRDMQKELKLEDNDYTGAVFEGKFYGPEEFKALETMPSRAEVYAKLLGVLQSPASGLVATLKAPAQELVFTLKAYVDKLEKEQA